MAPSPDYQIIILPNGDLDSHDEHSLIALFRSDSTTPARHLIIDMSELGLLKSSLAHHLADTAALLAMRGKQVHLCGCKEEMCRLIAETEPSHQLHFADTIDQAVEAIGKA